MADALYRRLRVYARAGDLFGGLFDKKPGRGGARPGSGGARPGAGRKRMIGPRLSEGRPEVKAREEPKRHKWPKRECTHEKPTFSNGKLRKKCFDCYPKPDPKPRKQYEPKEIVLAKCAAPGCENEFIKMIPGQIFCGKQCRLAVGNASDRHKSWVAAADVGGHRKRARRYGGKYVRFRLSDVLRRDGWSCRACGIPTPMVLRGLHAHNSPELDHVVPLSRGGDHTPENAQCLCRSCNLLKGNRTMGEFTAWLTA